MTDMQSLQLGSSYFAAVSDFVFRFGSEYVISSIMQRGYPTAGLSVYPRETMGQIQARVQSLDDVTRRRIEANLVEVGDTYLGQALGTAYDNMMATAGTNAAHRIPVSLPRDINFGSTTQPSSQHMNSTPEPSEVQEATPPVQESRNSTNEDDSGEFLCPVCWDTLKTPVITKCGHTFCRECLALSLNRRAECPLDRTRLSRTHDFKRNNLVESMIEKGPNPETVSRRQLVEGDKLELDPPAYLVCETHAGLLVNAHVECSSGNTVCGRCVPVSSDPSKYYKNTLVQKKVNSIPARCLNGWVKSDVDGKEVPMAYACTERFTFGELQVHDAKCPVATVPCPHSQDCGEMLRKDLRSHFENECTKIKCPHPSCSFRGAIREWRIHMTDNAYEHAYERVCADLRRQQAAPRQRSNTVDVVANVSQVVGQVRDGATEVLQSRELKIALFIFGVICLALATIGGSLLYVYLTRPEVAAAGTAGTDELAAAMERIEKLEALISRQAENAANSASGAGDWVGVVTGTNTDRPIPSVQESHVPIGDPNESNGIVSTLFWEAMNVLLLPLAPFTIMAHGLRVCMRSSCWCLFFCAFVTSGMAVSFMVLTCLGYRF